MMNIKITSFTEVDWPGIAAIYGEGIDSRTSTFETTLPSWTKWDRDHLADCRLAARNQDGILGWAALSPYSARAVYKGVAEVSIYVGCRFQGHQVGTRLLEALIAASEEAGFWTLQSTVISGNGASLRLHEKCGFRIVGVREQLAVLEGSWRDVILLERRSSRVGQA